MNNDTYTMLTIMWVLMALSGVFAYRSFFVVKGYLETRRRRKLFPSLESAKQELLCKEPHTWDRIKLIMTPLSPGLYTVCTTCGFVSADGGSFKLNGPALEVYKNELKSRLDAKLRWDQIERLRQERLENAMNKLIKDQVQTQDFTNTDLTVRIELLKDFFRKTHLEIEVIYSELNKELNSGG
jgi:hypothetical protein